MARDISQWLNDIGLGKYAELFIRHEIDGDVLPHVTSEDLKEMGLPIGVRRKVLTAIDLLNATRSRTRPSTWKKSSPNGGK